MANYRTHVTVSAMTGVFIAIGTYLFWQKLRWDALVLGIFFSFLGGMVPDLDHNQSHAIRKISSLFSSFLPILVLAIFSPSHLHGAATSLMVLLPCHYGLHWSFRQLAQRGTASYFGETTRGLCIAGVCSVIALLMSAPPWGFMETWILMFGVSLGIHFFLPLLRFVTVHRGVFHGLSAILIYSLLVYLMFHGDQHFGSESRLFLAVSAFFGAFSHLCLDEIYSVDFSGKKLRIKRSFGTALCVWDKKNPFRWFMSYVLVFCLGAMCLFSP